MYIYIYIERERDRERERLYIYIYVYTHIYIVNSRLPKEISSLPPYRKPQAYHPYRLDSIFIHIYIDILYLYKYIYIYIYTYVHSTCTSGAPMMDKISQPWRKHRHPRFPYGAAWKSSPGSGDVFLDASIHAQKSYTRV